MGGKPDKPSFWTTAPGILTAVAALLTAVAGLVAALHSAGVIGGPAGVRPAPPPAVTAPPGQPAGPPAPSGPPVSPPPAAPGAQAAPGAADCFAQYFEGIPSDRIRTLEEGARDVQLIGTRQSKEGPIGVRFTENRRPAGALRFSFFLANDLFKVESVVDAGCRAVQDYTNASRGGDGGVLQNWDTLRMHLDGATYELRLGYADGVIGANSFVRVTR